MLSLGDVGEGSSPNETFATPGGGFFIDKETKMPAEALKCKECQATYAPDASSVGARSFAPPGAPYDPPALDAAAALRRKTRAGPASIWRYADFLPFARRPKTAL